MLDMERDGTISEQAEAGTSLVEVMLAMAAGLLVLGATLQALMSFQRQFANQQASVSQQQDLRLGLELLEQELHLAEATSLSVMGQQEVEFGANVHGLVTTVSAVALTGQTTLSVSDGREWPERKTIAACWDDQCETMTLARDGQRAILTVTQPIAKTIPVGAAVSLVNRVRYYSRRDDNGTPRFLRQVDGGASVLVGDLQDVHFSYWDDRGQVAMQAALVRRIVVEVSLPRRASKAVREISLRT
jgi:Tfp pilus assembly protein PilW